ncbi:YhgE/Pip domain-containing protein [uncultured Bifidobacterium sp.]|uniref:YhgE/Pip domain-containing protein n=1 Tax=uncultured Bifidobacterium sp. TaxID=165187 RepID=UPI0028DC522F|nr:YhgE/Pip domain-containing protein [uncultured Bifidobacterium sp.]
MTFRILRRDLLRIARTPTVWIVIVGLVFLSPLYAWFNIIGFWNPYGNTGSIRVAVVNEDVGASESTLGAIHLGRDVVNDLKANDDLGWTFMTRSKAMAQVRSGTSYAAIIIPRDFSRSIAGIVTGGSQRPSLKYYVNEKANGIAARITDTGASTVDRQVNSAFVAAVSAVAAKAVNSSVDSLSSGVHSTSGTVVADIRSVQKNIATLESVIDDLDGVLADVPVQTTRARQTIATVQAAGTEAASSLDSTATLISTTQTSLASGTASASTSLDTASSLLSQTSSRSSLSITALAAQLTSANGTVESVIDKAQQVNDTTGDVIDALKGLDLSGTTAITDKLSQRNTALSTIISDLGTLNSSMGSTITSTAASSDAVTKATQSSLTAADKARSTLSTGAIPKLNSGLSTLSRTASTVSGQLTGQSSLLSQTGLILDQLDSTASSTRTALASTRTGLTKADSTLDTLAIDLTALGNSTALKDMLGSDGKLDVSKIATFMLSPTVLSTRALYPVSTYGSGMSPLFTNISLWVGAFVLMVIVRLETDDDDLDGEPTPGQRYWGRWLFLAIIAVGQALATTIGDLVIGVETASPGMFVLTGVITSLVYLSITYALSTTFMHVGKGLCVALIMLQIPGASGIYPIEMMPRFFRVLYPFFPFTYSISALRETIGGFYGLHWLEDIARLLVFAVLAFLLGLVVRPHLASVNRLFAREIREGDMIIGEPVQLPGGEYRLSQVIQALSDRTEYRQAIEERAAAFARRYPRLRRGALITGIIVPAVLAVVFSLTTGTKLLSLAAWFVWILLIIGFLMAIELMRDSIDRQVRLGTLDDEAIRRAMSESSGARRWMRLTRARAAARHADAENHATARSDDQPVDGTASDTAAGSENPGPSTRNAQDTQNTQEQEGDAR